MRLIKGVPDGWKHLFPYNRDQYKIYKSLKSWMLNLKVWWLNWNSTNIWEPTVQSIYTKRWKAKKFKIAFSTYLTL